MVPVISKSWASIKSKRRPGSMFHESEPAPGHLVDPFLFLPDAVYKVFDNRRDPAFLKKTKTRPARQSPPPACLLEGQQAGGSRWSWPVTIPRRQHFLKKRRAAYLDQSHSRPTACSRVNPCEVHTDACSSRSRSNPAMLQANASQPGRRSLCHRRRILVLFGWVAPASI